MIQLFFLISFLSLDAKPIKQHCQGNNCVQVGQNIGEIHIKDSTVQIGVNNGKVLIKYVGDPKDKNRIAEFEVAISNLTSDIQKHLETIRLKEKRSLSDREQLLKADEYVRQMKKRMDELTARLGNSFDRKALLAKYPLGYVIFELDHSEKVFPYDNSLMDKYDIKWEQAKISQNTDTFIELRLPEIVAKNGMRQIENAITGGPKRVGNLGGYFVGDVTVWGEILEIKDTGIVFLVGFEKNFAAEYDRISVIATKALDDFHALYNSDMTEDIWAKCSSKFKSTTEKAKYVKFIYEMKTRLGEFRFSTNTRFSVDFNSHPPIVTINQNSIYQNKQIFEVFLIVVDGNTPSLLGWNIWKSEKDALRK